FEAFAGAGLGECRERWGGASEPFTEGIGRRLAERKRSIAQRTVTRTAAEIAAHRVGIAGSTAPRTIVFREEADHEAGRAVSALRSATFGDGALRFAQAA